MLRELTLDEACIIIQTFAEVNHLDSLSAIEAMVKHYPKLATHEQNAVSVFMTGTKKNSRLT